MIPCEVMIPNNSLIIIMRNVFGLSCVEFLFGLDVT